jgi:pantoate--beta-alanine ligase
MSGTCVRHDDRASLATALEEVRSAGGAIAFVPTMGALHVGHRMLVERAAQLAPVVVVSIFVNPTQFDAATDLASYPRTLDADLALLADVAEATGTDLLVYVPTVEDVYPDGATSTVHVPEVTEHLCGASRPGHFDGVATVVDALLRAVRPTVLVMGRKDHQQLVVVRRLIALRGHDVELDAAPTVRDVDAVAISSRNSLLDGPARAAARHIPRALAAGVAEVRAARSAGDAVSPETVRRAAAAELARSGDLLRIDYLETVDPDRIVPVVGPQRSDASLLLAVAVHVRSGERTVRLIDNVLLGDVADEQRLLDALERGLPRDGDPVRTLPEG